jgi:hypothetical protein
LDETEPVESWFSRAKAEADKGVPPNDRFVSVVIVVVSILMMLYFAAHQVWSTGFFTTAFGTVEAIMLYGNLTAWAVTGFLEGVLCQRLLSRLFDVFGGIIFITISLAWLTLVFPFNFAYFADVLPDFLRFLVQWVSNDVARGLMVIGVIVFAVVAFYSPIAYKFVSKERFKRQSVRKQR